MRETIVLGPEDSATGKHRVHYRAADGETGFHRRHGRDRMDAQQDGIWKAPLNRSEKLRALTWTTPAP